MGICAAISVLNEAFHISFNNFLHSHQSAEIATTSLQSLKTQYCHLGWKCFHVNLEHIETAGVITALRFLFYFMVCSQKQEKRGITPTLAGLLLRCHLLTLVLSTCVVCNIAFWDKVMTRYIWYQLKSINFLHPFHSGLGTKTNVSMVENFHLVMDKGQVSMLILSDLSKAFDIIEHEMLLTCL